MGIKSKPEYRELAFDEHATRHVLIGEGVGADALVRVARQASAAEDAGATESFDVLYLPAKDADDADRLRSSVAPASVAVYDDMRALESGLRRLLSTASMGTRLYLAGTEAFIWRCVAVAREAGLEDDEVQRERCGSFARPVQCVHCKAVAPAVTTNIYSCPGCGLSVMVRDHFSRRLGAYQSVCVDAEAPGEIPAIEEIYP